MSYFFSHSIFCKKKRDEQYLHPLPVRTIFLQIHISIYKSASSLLPETEGFHSLVTRVHRTSPEFLYNWLKPCKSRATHPTQPPHWIWAGLFRKPFQNTMLFNIKRVRKTRFNCLLLFTALKDFSFLRQHGQFLKYFSNPVASDPENSTGYLMLNFWKISSVIVCFRKNVTVIHLFVLPVLWI